MRLTVTARDDDFVAVRFTGGKTAQAVGLVETAPDLLAESQRLLARLQEMAIHPSHYAGLAAAIARATGVQ